MANMITAIFDYDDGTSKNVSRPAEDLEFERTISTGFNYLRILNVDPSIEIILDKFVTTTPTIIKVVIQYNGVTIVTVEKEAIIDVKYGCNYVKEQARLWEYIELHLR